MKIYHNGNLSDEKMYDEGIVYGDAFMNLGNNNFSNRSFFVGSMDELSIFNRALLSDEIKKTTCYQWKSI